jgi:hypothetical protein
MTVTTGDELQVLATRVLRVAGQLNRGAPVPVAEYQRAMAALRAWRDSADQAPPESPETTH